MTSHVLFVQGAAQGAYDEDEKLVASLRGSLGPGYHVHYPAMPDEDEADYDQWKAEIAKELTAVEPDVLIGHSVGASILIKCLTEIELALALAGVFLIATPFWGGDGWRYEGYERLTLPSGFAARLPSGVPVFLYHGREDEIVPFDHLALYARELPHASVRELEGRGHQLGNDLSIVADDIRSL
jgi:predicted alpha/beta hydrolase family esterase